MCVHVAVVNRDALKMEILCKYIYLIASHQACLRLLGLMFNEPILSSLMLQMMRTSEVEVNE